MLGAEQHRLSLVDPTVAAFRGLHVAALKLLRSAPGQDKQPAHYDVTHYKDAVQRYAVLMYCTSHCSPARPSRSPPKSHRLSSSRPHHIHFDRAASLTLAAN